MRNSSETKDSWTNTLKLPVHAMRDSADIKSRQSWLCALTVTSIPIVAITLPREKLSLSFFECGICIAIGEICPLLYKLGYLSSFREDIVKKTKLPFLLGIVSLVRKIIRARNITIITYNHSHHNQLIQVTLFTAFSPPVILFALLRFIFSASWVAIRIKSELSSVGLWIQLGFFLIPLSIWSFLFSMIMSSSLSALALIFVLMYKEKNHTANAPYVNVSTSDEKAVLDPFMNLDILEEQPKNESVKKVKRKTRKKRKRSEIPQLKFSKADKDTRLFVYWDSEKRWYAGSVMTYNRGMHTIVFDDGDVKTFDLLRVKTHFGKTPPALHEENSMSDLKITEEEKDDISDELFQKFKVYYAKHNPDLSARNIKSLLKKHRTRAQLSVLVQKIHKKYGERIMLDDDDETDSDDEDDFYNDDEEDTFDDLNDDEEEETEEEEKLDDVAGEIHVSVKSSNFYDDDKKHFESAQSSSQKTNDDFLTTTTMPQSDSISKLVFYAIGMVSGAATSIVVSLSCLFHDSISFGMCVILTSWIASLIASYLSDRIPTRPNIYLFLSGLSLLCTWESKSTLRFLLIVVHIFFLCSGTLQFARSMSKDAIDIGCGMGRFFGILLAMYLLKFWSSTTVLFSFSFLPLILVAFNFYYGVNLSGGGNNSDGTKRGKGVFGEAAWYIGDVQSFWIS